MQASSSVPRANDRLGLRSRRSAGRASRSLLLSLLLTVAGAIGMIWTTTAVQAQYPVFTNANPPG